MTSFDSFITEIPRYNSTAELLESVSHSTFREVGKFLTLLIEYQFIDVIMLYSALGEAKESCKAVNTGMKHLGVPISTTLKDNELGWGVFCSFDMEELMIEALSLVHTGDQAKAEGVPALLVKERDLALLSLDLPNLGGFTITALFKNYLVTALLDAAEDSNFAIIRQYLQSVASDIQS